jgi:hypothetical protein
MCCWLLVHPCLQFMIMTPKDELEAQVEAEQRTVSSTGSIHPLSKVYR